MRPHPVHAAWLAGVLVISAGCTQPVHLVIAPIGTWQAERDAEAPRIALATSDDNLLLGVWSGTGIQSDGGEWPMRVELTGLSGHCGTITYPTVPCRGIWLCEAGPASADGWREARENIESGACIDGGTFRYRVRGDSLEWTWYKTRAARRSEEDNLTARGILTRDSSDGKESKSWVEDED